jgi:hypothetical protein
MVSTFTSADSDVGNVGFSVKGCVMSGEGVCVDPVNSPIARGDLAGSS